MRNDETHPGGCPTEREEALADQSRRAFVRKAALIGLPVVLASIPSRTVWAKPRQAAGKGKAGTFETLDASVPISATHSHALGNVNPLFPHA